MMFVFVPIIFAFVKELFPRNICQMITYSALHKSTYLISRVISTIMTCLNPRMPLHNTHHLCLFGNVYFSKQNADIINSS